MPVKQCAHCGISFSVRPDSLLCPSCRYPTLVCMHCGESFRPDRISNQDFRKHGMPHYCSRTCGNKGRRLPLIPCKGCGKLISPRRKRGHNKPQTQYCSQKCFLKTKQGTMKCLQCGKEMSLPLRQSRERRFCSQTCSNRYNQQPDPEKKAVFKCKWCGRDFEAWAYRHPTICSAQCRSEYGARQPKPNKRKPEIHVLRHCAYCGAEYHTTTHQIRFRGSQYCSRACHYGAMRETRRAENNPMWKGGHNPDAYGPNWREQSREARRRDGWICQRCGWFGYRNQRLHVHHIRPLREFDGDWQKANELPNLVTLCIRCHILVENGKATIPMCAPAHPGQPPSVDDPASICQ